jgi:hypothetical protein
MRNQFGHFINDEKHDGEELTVGGRQHSRDPMGMMEDTTDDGDTWDKTTARSRRLATRKESSNGTAEQWLAGDERAAVAHLGIGEKAIKGVEASAKRVFIGGGERERGVWWSHISVTGCQRRAGLAEPWRMQVSPVVSRSWVGLGRVLNCDASLKQYRAILFIDLDH